MRGVKPRPQLRACTFTRWHPRNTQCCSVHPSRCCACAERARSHFTLGMFRVTACARPFGMCCASVAVLATSDGLPGFLSAGCGNARNAGVPAVPRGPRLSPAGTTGQVRLHHIAWAVLAFAGWASKVSMHACPCGLAVTALSLPLARRRRSCGGCDGGTQRSRCRYGLPLPQGPSH
jgi:hypothetical protein